jgi:sortase (surface protein transpeptidase)
MMLMAMLCGGSAALAWTAGHTDSAAATATASQSGPVLVAHTPVRAGPRPVRIVIPTIAVNADIEALHRAADGTLGVPPHWTDAGWYADGVVPGQQGPAVIVGHVDSRTGPAVFYHLPRLRHGDEVLVETSDGQSHRFVVDTAHAFSKNSFPTQLVYGPTPLAELRLITCTGSFDRATHNYSENLVVTAYAA